MRWTDLRWGQLAPGTPLGIVANAFPRIEKAEAIERMENPWKRSTERPRRLTTHAQRRGHATPAAGAPPLLRSCRRQAAREKSHRGLTKATCGPSGDKDAERIRRRRQL